MTKPIDISRLLAQKMEREWEYARARRAIMEALIRGDGRLIDDPRVKVKHGHDS